MPIICEGCGQTVPIPEGYRRNKIQCACGVICPVPESARQEANAPARKRSTPAAKAPPAVEQEAERWLLDDGPSSAPPSEPPRFRDPEPVEKPAPAKPAVIARRFPCRRCGRLVRRQGECPSCDADKVPATAKEELVWWPSVDTSDDTEEEDSSPYAVEGGDEVRCPKCSFMLPPGSVLCVRCGFHLQKRKKIAKIYQPIERVWETNLPLSTRLTAFCALEILALALGLIGAFVGGADLSVFLGSFLGLTAMVGFLFGTFDRIRLTRDARGWVRLVKTWRVCFIPLEPKAIDVRGYEGIISGQHRDVSVWEYWIFFFLLFFAIVPGLIWWYLAIYKITYHVSLSRDHGFPARIVYSGWSTKQMKEIAYALRNATGLRYDEG
ncbi:MAG TPA: hypothetical protein VH682_20140 [Gemmataceae bacterium]